MRTVTATQASRGFSDVLDAVEHGSTITITRGGVPIAELRPVPTATGRVLGAELDSCGARLDEGFEADVAAATDLLTAGEGDPWSGA